MSVPNKLDLKQLAVVAGTCVAYLVTAWLAFHLNSTHPYNVSFVWLPSAVALSAVVLWGYEALPGVIVGAFLASFGAGVSPPLALVLSLGSAVEALVGAYILRQRFDFDPMFRRLIDAFSLFVVALTAPLVLATLVAVTLRLSGILPSSNFSSVWVQLWESNAIGIILFAPFLMRWSFKPWFIRSRGELLEGIFLFVSLVVMDVLVFWVPVSVVVDIPMVYLMLVPLIWAALRAGPRGMTLALFATSSIALASAAYGPYAATQTNPANALFLTQMFLVVINILFMLFVSIVEERKEAVVTLRSQIQKLDEVIERLRVADETKSEFIATLAHELRNPLAPIVSSLELLRQREMLPQNADLVKTIEAHTVTIARLLDDLLDVTRITRKRFKLHKETVNLKAVINRSAETVASFFTSRGHTLKLELPPYDIWLLADMVRLEQVFVNLLFNAGKYTAPGGTITLTANIEDKRLRVVVSDTGIGIEPNMTEKIFEPFFQAKSAGGRMGSGLGLGLALTKRLVELHGGSIVAKSEGLGKGSQFVVDLPLPASVQLPFELSKTGPITATRNAPQRVLIIDDNEAAANALGALLRHGGHEVELAYSGETALATAKEMGPTAVLLDIGLPDMSGYEVARQLRQDLPGPLFLVALTGYGQDSDKERAREAGFDHHLTKPVTIADVERLLLRAKRAVQKTA